MGMYQFISGFKIPEKAICTDYCSVFSLSRKDYKDMTSDEETKLKFYQRSLSVALFMQE